MIVIARRAERGVAIQLACFVAAQSAAPATELHVLSLRGAQRRSNPSRWIASSPRRARLLLMNSKGLSLRARLGGRGNPAEIQDGSPRRFAPRDDKQGSLPIPSNGSAVVSALAMTGFEHTP
jgi:hypothetical protein